MIIIREPTNSEKIREMAEPFFGLRIKLAVDVAKEILAGGGELHCQQNVTMEVRDLQLKSRIEKIVRYLLEVV
ncbi:MAG: hypothetical protein ACK47D_06410 [Pseudanabaena sp.]|jgi:hypothetical protein|uniref:hypothetical protein n=1 Tax=Cyanophyceae TaxID=3028117 RepID=UPI000E8C921A|nr:MULTISPECIES: hypothetical protein [Cyanophyceae]MCA6572553.1 hypothetical protein [Pseudanabaena sp. M53BS1SP1A06MG]MCA6590891.1 hypothetical protein [Pseudanabaena sp. M38BS1SP1A06MG]MCA6595117.1 hypothetical protein [Pseudanabaena sp. M046S1SP1A06QC]MCA6602059.1 hypothetical protein [Pseudanabaena sp. M57BS1SP1A06MG]MCA6603893.1 hypothetical protein [Pseudanabaena sp. M007S1SP1A06QC]HBC41926.1 hypothetical protein [Pseudanabaena sp.]